jgi:hypothetical protein
VDSVIRRNHSGGMNPCGGIRSFGTLTIVASTITENTGGLGGGGGVCGGIATVILQSSIIANRALDFGGGGILGDLAANGPTVTVGSLLVQNSTVARNTASSILAPFRGGAGVLVSQATFINSTIADNVNESEGPGAGIDVERTRGLVTMVNTILARNQNTPVSGGPLAPSDCAGSLTSFGNNLIGDPSGCTVTLLPTDLTGDPGLGRFKDNGRPGNGHFPLRHTSQAIDAGNDSICPRVDQLERPRLGPCDIGAIRSDKDKK